MNDRDGFKYDQERPNKPGRPVEQGKPEPGVDYLCPWCDRAHIRAGPHKGERVSQKMVREAEASKMYKGTPCKSSPCRRGFLRMHTWKQKMV